MLDDKQHQKKEVFRLFGKHADGRLTRRQLLGELGKLGLGAAAVAWLAGHSPIAVRQALAAGATAEERALTAAAELAKTAAKKTISILHPSGSAGNMRPFIQEWKDATGIDIELIEAPLTEMHVRGMQEAVARSGRYDLMLPSPISLPDFAESGLIYNLSEWFEKYDPEIYSGDAQIPFPFNAHGMTYRGEPYGIFTDGDMWLLYIRGDMLNDPEEQAAFKSRYGKELQKPASYEEYDQQLEFFTRKDKSFYGGLEYRSPYYTKWQWMQRFVSKGHLYFDANMEPTCEHPDSIATLEEMLRLNEFLPPEAFSHGWSENYNAFGQGVGYCSFSWPSFFRYNNDPSISPLTAGNIAVAECPGTMVNGELVRASLLPFSWCWVVSQYSQIPELAYLYMQWLSGPTMSMRSIPNQGGYFDPYRANHFRNPSSEMVEAYSEEWLEIGWKNVPNVIPDLCLKGGFEYQDALDKNINRVMTGQADPASAMADAAREIRRITRRLGQDEQVSAWHALAQTFPDKIRAVAGVDSWQ